MIMRRILYILSALFLCMSLCEAQVPYRETVPDIRYHVCGERRLSRLSDDDALFTILAFEDEDAAKETLPVWYTDDAIKPYFQNYNPDYGRTLLVVSLMKNRKSIERNLGILSEEDVAPFRNEFSVIHMMGDKD